jgi:hypothetical protein
MAKQKSPAENRGAFDLDIVNEDVPSLADLAATYSSKPWDLVPSAQRTLTAEFGMGSGMGSSL